MSELRKDPIIDRWVIISAERGRRPNDFYIEPDPPAGPNSPFAPGNENVTPPEVFQIGRDAKAAADSPGWRVRVVPNKFPALSPDGTVEHQGLGMFDLMSGVGAHEVIIENPGENWDPADASPTELQDVLHAYSSRVRTLQSDERFRYVLVFRNNGTRAGASIAHPHSQVMALPIVPQQVLQKLEAARDYYDRKRRCLFDDIVRQELAMGDRVVEATDEFVVLSPFAARFPFELQILPRRHSHDFSSLGESDLAALSHVLGRSLRRLKNALGAPAYNLILHTAPAPDPRSGEKHSTIAQDFLWHIEILPRLTGVAGFEWGTGFYINPVSPEQATQFLRDTPV
ncbi:MAG TPA: galactose-1-phosphate uridylyltransferase [Abditibacteriaceae bacterium]|jgi:UDPglucose--hexose-1-phosphate uridylyltransferase